MRKPYYNKARKLWYVWAGKKQVNLGPDEEIALQKWHEIELSNAISRPDPPIVSVAEAFLSWAESHRSPATFEFYRRYVTSFSDFGGRTSVSRLKVHHVDQWLATHQTWGASSKRAAITSIKSLFNWAVRRGILAINPISGIERPPTPRRETLISAEDHERIRQASDPAFRILVTALRLSGCRPGEISILTAQHFDERNGFWIYQDHKTRSKTGTLKAVPLHPCLNALSRILASARPSGPLFINSDGKAWTRNAMRCRFRRLRGKLDLPTGTVAYAYRHTFATEGLVNGVDSATMATILGHTSTRMLMERYAHLGSQAQHLKDAVKKASRLATDQ
jgi:integrase